MTTIIMQLRDLPITIHGIQMGLLFGMVGGLILMVLYPKGRLNDVAVFVTALQSVGSLATFAISHQLFF